MLIDASFITLEWWTSLQERDYEERAETKPSFSPKHAADDDIMESDVELDNADVVEPDNEPPQPVGVEIIIFGYYLVVVCLCKVFSDSLILLSCLR